MIRGAGTFRSFALDAACLTARKHLFTKFGKLSPGYGFVHYETEEAAKQARCISLPSCFAGDLAVSDALGWLWLAEGP